MLGEFLQLFVHLGTQQLALTMLFLVTLAFVTVNFDMVSPKPAPGCFASTNSTHSPAQRKNGEYNRELMTGIVFVYIQSITKIFE